MPRLNNTTKTFLVNELKIKLNEKFGYHINTKPDCAKLSQIIMTNLSEHVSESTLYRFFILKESPKISQAILNILARLIGHTDWSSFELYVDEKNHTKLILGASANSILKPKSLIYHNIALGCYKPLEALFEEAVHLENDLRFEIVLDVFDSLLQLENPQPFFKHFANTPLIRNYFFEIGFDPLFRIKHYDEGLKLYAERVLPERGLTDIQDHVFSSTVLFRHYYLSKEYAKAIEYGKQLYQQYNYLTHDLEAIYAFPQMRYLSYKIWYLLLIGSPITVIDDYILWLLDYCKIQYVAFGLIERRVLFTCVAEALIVANKADMYQLPLKEIFLEEYKLFPDLLYHKSLKHSLPYFDQNCLLRYRPA
jgi:hypothetical protein